jgi:quercetin dioxygenase-like cupin family protein
VLLRTARTCPSNLPGEVIVHQLFIAAVALSAASSVLAHAQRPNWPGTKRTDLQRHDLSIAGHETLQARVEFEPGSFATRHKHPGEEIIYVLEGTLEYQIDGSPPVVLKAGDVLFVPAGAVHRARNVGEVRAAELATYVLEKGKPLTELAEEAPTSREKP